VLLVTAFILIYAFVDDPPKSKKGRDTTKAEIVPIIHDSNPNKESPIQMEQKILSDQIKGRAYEWDSLMLKQDSLIKKK